MDEILAYLDDTYAPSAIIVYGSYANGTNAEQSDFDALIVTERAHPRHDGAVISGVPLDVFLYDPAELSGDVAANDFIQLYDGHVLRDTKGFAAAFINRIRACIDSQPMKTDEEISHQIEWCEKMLHRTQRGDAEGYFRWHWLLVDSLEIYFDACKRRYFGPKKALRTLQAEDPAAAELYEAALRQFSEETLSAWIAHIRRANH